MNNFNKPETTQTSQTHSTLPTTSTNAYNLTKILNKKCLEPWLLSQKYSLRLKLTILNYKPSNKPNRKTHPSYNTFNPKYKINMILSLSQKIKTSSSTL